MSNIFSIAKKTADSTWFQTFIILVILAAGILVGIQTYGSKVAHIAPLLNTIDNIILFIFTVEVIVKIMAEGNRPFNYFKDPWNIFDFLIVAVCYLAFIMPDMNAGFIAVLRLARILRVFKLVTAVPKLQLLVGALLKSIPSMGYVGILLGLLFYIYAAMGVFIFGENDPLHFGNLQRGMLSLFRVVTLEDWTDIMYINIWGCNHPIWGYDAEMGCLNPDGHGVVGALYFVSFVLLGTMIVLNLFIGVIMNSMDEARAEAEMEMVAKNKKEHTFSATDELNAMIRKLDELKSEMEILGKKIEKVNNE